ncbi:FMN-binding domain protein [Pirellula staleyi DSM 6068]|uniref:FMN-binding domain protein n=1 Tax=Pirellula staleyi (strain ATCC 27377 / DSM 6068 / ICPB 4128) TaxID=530564 RepID=D2R8W6_PIRSD|nr:FMN-binding protein [Pirellula staleyi]ADB15793.1 FMN-binding domain protein [Pirellula staleyi DSM 6068]
MIARKSFTPLVTMALCLALSIPLSAAEIVFLDGQKLEAKVLSKDSSTIKVEETQAGKTITKTYDLSTIHTVTINGKRYVINEREAAAEPAAGMVVRRTKAEVEKMISDLGRQPPDWFDNASTDWPESLDLSWPDKPPGGWNNQKNVGQYVWDVINPNPNKWQEGVKLMHHLLLTHQSDPAKRTRAMLDLGRMYHNLHQDYARAAYWWRQAGVERNGPPSLIAKLAECYFHLGNKAMAVELMSKQKTISTAHIKLWADMGDIAKAVQFTKLFAANVGSGADEAYLYVADGYRQAGNPQASLEWYQKVLAIKQANPPNGRLKRSQERAQRGIEAVKLFDLADATKVADGTYEEESIGYEGPVRISLTVKGGKITALSVIQHREKQFYSALTDTPQKIQARQGVKGVDATSNATITSQAIINATAKALASGSNAAGGK